MAAGKGHIPIRTCISCGSKKNKKELLRLVLDEKCYVISDDGGKSRGRGTYVCRNRSCKDQLMNNKRLNRAFRTDKAISISSNLDSGV